MPWVVFREPISRKKGTQTVAMTTPKILNWWSVGMLVIPKTEVTKVSGRKKIETYANRLLGIRLYEGSQTRIHTKVKSLILCP